MALALEDFAGANSSTSMDDPAAGSANAAKSYEQGYQAGWDDANKAESDEQNRIGAELARHLQEMSFTFHEARAHVIQAMEPLLNGLVNSLLPMLIRDSMGQRIIETLTPMIESAADSPVELAIAPCHKDALAPHLEAAGIVAISLIEEPTLTEGQAFIRVGKAERQVDLTEALEQISKSISAVSQLNERAIRHG